MLTGYLYKEGIYEDDFGFLHNCMYALDKFMPRYTNRFLLLITIELKATMLFMCIYYLQLKFTN